MKVESRGPASCWLRARASNSCLMRAHFSCSSCVIRSLLSVTSWQTGDSQGLPGCRLPYTHPTPHLGEKSVLLFQHENGLLLPAGGRGRGRGHAGARGPRGRRGQSLQEGMVRQAWQAWLSLQDEGAGRHRAGPGPQHGYRVVRGHSPCRHRPQPAAPPGTEPPPVPWAVVAPEAGGSPQPRSPGRQAGGSQRAAQSQPLCPEGVPTGGTPAPGSYHPEPRAQGSCWWGSVTVRGPSARGDVTHGAGPVPAQAALALLHTLQLLLVPVAAPRHHLQTLQQHLLLLLQLCHLLQLPRVGTHRCH